MGLSTLLAAAPAPVDRSGRVLYPLSGKGLRVVHDRVDALSSQVLTACHRFVYFENPTDSQAMRDDLHEAVDVVLGAAPYWCPRVDRHRAWVVSAGVDAGGVPWEFDAVMALAISGVTEVAIDAEGPSPSRLMAEKLAPLVLDRLAEQYASWLSASGMSPEEQAGALAATVRSMAADLDGAVEATAIALRTRSLTAPAITLDDVLSS